MGNKDRAIARVPKTAAAIENVLKAGVPALLALGLAACGGGGGGGSSSGGGGSATPANQAGTVALSGTAAQNQTLTATVSDGNGVPATIAYQWMANGAAIASATAKTYGLTQADVGKTITVKATYTDSNGYAEAPVSAATGAVADVNDAPTLSLAGSGVSLLGVPGQSRAMGSRRLSSGQILLSGTVDNGLAATSDFMLARLNSDGTLDAGFGGNGLVRTDFAGQYDYGSAPPVILADGKILLGGSATLNVADGTDFALVRYNADGSLDTTFGQGGKLTIDFQHGSDRINKILVQPDGRIVAVGSAYDASPTLKSMEIAMVRLMPDGSLDASFGNGGKAISTLTSTGAGEIEDAVLMTDGRLVVTGEMGSGTFMARFSSTGALDSNFPGSVGVNTNMLNSYRLALGPNGSIYVIGSRDVTVPNIEWVIAKYGSDGLLDPTFGTNGETLMDFSATADIPMDITVLGNGSVLVAGYADSEAYSGRYNMAMVKLTPAGQLDTAFGSGGRLVYDLSGSHDIAYGMEVAPDGRILLSGAIYNQDTASYEAAAGRLLPNGDPDTSFGQPIGRYLEGQSPGVIVGGAHGVDVDVPAGGNYAGYVLKIQRSGGAMASDVVTGIGSVQLNGGQALYNGLNVGSYASSSGVFTLTFNAATTQSLLDQVMSSLAFSSTDIHSGGRLALDWTLTDPQGLAASARSVFYIGDDFADVLDRQLTFYTLGTMYSPWQNNGSVFYAGSTSTTLATFSRWLTGSPSGLSEVNRTNLLATRGYNSLNVKMLDLAEAQTLFANSARPSAYTSGEFWTATGGGGQYAVINMGTGAVRYATYGSFSERHPGLFSVQ